MKYLIKHPITNKIFERRNIGIVYHFTSLINTYHIIEEDAMRTHREMGDDILKMYKKAPKHGITFSFTRNKNLHKTLEQGQIDTPLTTRLTFDGTKLSDNYIIRPYHWQHEKDKEDLDAIKKGKGSDYMKNPKENSFEYEQMLITNKHELPNISKYLLNVEIPTLEEFKKEFESYIDSEPYMFFKLEDIVNLLDYQGDFDEMNQEYDDDLIEETYKFIVDSIEYNFGFVKTLN